MIAGMQVDKYCGPRARRYLKRCAARRVRRIGRLLLDDAPRRRGFAGWYS